MYENRTRTNYQNDFLSTFRKTSSDWEICESKQYTDQWKSWRRAFSRKKSSRTIVGKQNIFLNPFVWNKLLNNFREKQDSGGWGGKTVSARFLLRKLNMSGSDRLERGLLLERLRETSTWRALIRYMFQAVACSISRQIFNRVGWASQLDWKIIHKALKLEFSCWWTSEID